MRVRASSRTTEEGSRTEPEEHHADKELERPIHLGGQGRPQAKNGSSQQENRGSVAGTPARSNHRRPTRPGRVGKESADRSDMVRFAGVTGTERQAKKCARQEVGHVATEALTGVPAGLATCQVKCW